MDKILFAVISIFGIFIFNVPEEHNLIYTPQFALLVLLSGLLLGLNITRHNKYIGWLCWLVTIGFFRTILSGKFSKFYLFESYIILMSGFLIYYNTYKLKLKESLLKFFLVPAVVNILFIFIQRFYPNLLYFIRSDKISGIFGNAGFTSVFLGVCTPLFIRYLPYGIPFLLLAILFCKGSVGLLIALSSLSVYAYTNKKKWYKNLFLLLSIVLLALMLKSFYMSEIKIRVAYWIATLDGIMHHPILGWGLGSYVSVFARIPATERFFGIAINSPSAILNHPHNELLFGWWNFGIAFPIIIFLIIKSIVKSFNKEKMLTTTILIGCGIAGLLSIYTPAVLAIMLLSLGIYDNEKEEICQ